MRFSLLKFSFLFILFATGFITPVNKDYHYYSSLFTKQVAYKNNKKTSK